MKNYNCDYTAHIGQRQKNEVNYMLLYFLKFPLKASMILYWGKAQNYVLKKKSLMLMVGWGDRINKTNKQKKENQA